MICTYQNGYQIIHGILNDCELSNEFADNFRPKFLESECRRKVQTRIRVLTQIGCFLFHSSFPPFLL